MKRGGPPRRRKPLNRGGALTPGQGKRSMGRKPLQTKQQADRRIPQTAKVTPEWQQARMATMWRASGACQAARPGCRGRGSQAHHLLPRSAGGDDDLANLAWVCDLCHGWIHGHPRISYRLGLLRWRGWQPPVPDDHGRLHYPDAIDVHDIGYAVWLPDNPNPAWRELP